MSSILPHQQAVVDLARDIFGPDFIPLHRPVFEGNERQYLVDCIDSNFVSSVGAKVTEFEQQVALRCMRRCCWPVCSATRK
jgi:dTDP-4-amino-4,6-dideoxygalactose transaminase